MNLILYPSTALLFTLILQVISRISDEKCKEYGKAVYVKKLSPVLSRRSRIDTVSECGIVSVPLIVGGVKVTKKEFPHMAQIGFVDQDNEIDWACGGSLISEVYVLTAAHCLNSRDKGDAKFVQLGVIQLGDEDEDEQQIRNVKRRISHPNYKKPSKYHDIALIEMNEAVEFTPYVRPACLNSLNNPGNSKAIATGFGKLNYGATSGSEHLMKVILDIINLDRCKKVFENDKLSYKNGLDSNVLCVGVLEGGKDTCQGDSGGPLQIILKEPYCMYSIIGVTSTGKFCGYANAPAIYTKTSNYLDWIESIVW